MRRPTPFLLSFTLLFLVCVRPGSASALVDVPIAGNRARFGSTFPRMRGRDFVFAFDYTVRDSAGNLSAPARVTFTITGVDP